MCTLPRDAKTQCFDILKYIKYMQSLFTFYLINCLFVILGDNLYFSCDRFEFGSS